MYKGNNKNRKGKPPYIPKETLKGIRAKRIQGVEK